MNDLKETITQTLYDAVATRKQPSGASFDHFSMDYKQGLRVNMKNSSIYVDGNVDLGYCADKIIEALVDMEVE